MLNFKIINSSTEKLTIFNYIENDNKLVNIPLNISYRGFIEDIDDIIKFKVYYDVESLKFPISLNWIGTFYLEFKNIPENLSVDDLFMDEIIQNALNKYIEQFSMNFIGQLPSFSKLIEDKS